jgi:lactate 2-monooxygenase
VLVVTLDTFMIGWRPSDLDESYLPFVWVRS